jgi:hypothetical protein
LGQQLKPQNLDAQVSFYTVTFVYDVVEAFRPKAYLRRKSRAVRSAGLVVEMLGVFSNFLVIGCVAHQKIVAESSKK